MQNWKIEYIGNSIVTAGDNGRVSFFDLISKEKVKKIDSGEIFLTAMTKSNDAAYQFLATANNNGDVFIFNLGNFPIIQQKKIKWPLLNHIIKLSGHLVSLKTPQNFFQALMIILSSSSI